MKIESIQVVTFFSNWRNQILLKIKTDTGIEGIAEATLRNKEKAVSAAIEYHIAPLIIGKDIFYINELIQKFYARDAWRSNGGVVFITAVSAIETALWDIIGKDCGEPIYNLMGGAFQKEILCYLTINSELKDCNSDDEVAEAAIRCAEQGFRGIKLAPLIECKIHPELSKVDAAVRIVHLVREAVGKETGIMVDIGASFNYDEALKFVKETEDDDLWFIEEPLYPDDIDGFDRLVDNSKTPLAAGERVFARYGQRYFVQKRNLSILQPDVTHCGGLMETRIIGGMANAHCMQIAPHNSNGIVATVAAAMVDSVMENFFMQEINTEILENNRNYLKNPVTFKDSKIILPDGPGLGIDVDWSVIQENYKSVHSYS